MTHHHSESDSQIFMFSFSPSVILFFFNIFLPIVELKHQKMGLSNSKTETCEPLRLCRERKRYMRQAIDSRYNLAAAHLLYNQSLHNFGIALAKFAEIQVSVQCNSTLNYMKSSGVNPNPSTNNKVYVDHDVESSSPQPPPRFSWDYFNPTDGSFRLMGRVVKPDQNGTLIGGEMGENGGIEECDGGLTEETDFVSSVKDVEGWFIRASKLGNEVSRMLEANQIQITYSDTNGGSTGSASSVLTCFRGENALVLHEPQQTTKVITWKRSISSNSSLLRLPGPPDDENNFVEEFCMIAGSHSSTLDRLYAWERKLYDEVKASESIRKEYDRKCDELRHQFAKDCKPQVIDKTRAVAKDLHSRMKVALHTVDSISKRIEKMRDEELQPQLMELIQGLMRMWKSMIECHHAQYIAISSCNHSRTRTHHDTKNHTIMVELEHEIECFGSSFSSLVKSYTSYVESINNWLQNCIVQPKERVKGRRAFSPRRAVGPPIFVMCRDWSVGIRTLPSQRLSDVVKEFLCHVRRLSVEEEMKKKELSLIENGDDVMKIEGSNLSMIHGSLTKVFDRLTNYCEESYKMYEEIKEKSESAGNLYSNYRRPTRPSIV